MMTALIKKILKRENILVIVLVITTLLGLLGVPQTIGIASEQVILALLGVLAVDTLIERLGYLDRIEAHIAHLGDKIEPRVSAGNLLRSRAELPSFTARLQQNDEIWLAGENLFGVVTSYGRQIEQAAKDGKKFRFLIVNPDNPSLLEAIALRSFTQPTASSVEQLLREAIAHFERLCGSAPQGTIEVRLADCVFTTTYLIADGKKPNGQMVIEIYGYKIATGERLHLELTRGADGRIFAFHHEQFESMWRDAKPLPVQSAKAS